MYSLCTTGTCTGLGVRLTMVGGRGCQSSINVKIIII